jgi:hypothetical protein
MTIVRPLNPKILSLNFHDQMICDIPNIVTENFKKLGLKTLIPNFQRVLTDTIKNDPPNTIYHVRLLVLCFASCNLLDRAAFETVLIP